MAKRITAFAAADGTLFTDPAECANYEKTTMLAVGVAAALTALGVSGAMVYPNAPHDDDSVDLQTFLINNSEVLVEALSVQQAKAQRQPRQPKVKENLTAGLGVGVALAEATVTKAVITDGAVGDKTEIAPIVIKAEETPATDAVVAPADTAAGQNAEDELAALLGGDAAPGEVTL